MWFEKLDGKTRVGRMVYLSKKEYNELTEEAENIKSMLRIDKITLSDIIRVRCFYSKKYFKLRVR